MRGKFIVIDGSDGSGKATQTSMVIEKLREKGKEVFKCDFPRYDTFFGRMVGSYLNGKFGDPVNINPYLASLMYAGDRWTMKHEINEALNDGKIVIANRYVSSNMAHQGSKLEPSERGKFLSWLEELEFEVYGIPKPDKVIILYVPPDMSQKLIDKKNKRDYTTKKRDGHESNISYLTETAKFYKELAKSNGWKVIDCFDEEKKKLLSIEDINEMIMDELDLG